ncbi:hypothetical protein KXS11_11550 [Plantibacter flavus]|uniref:hypothetical protein n=1 Tax=Plantibacter flavus TaxID=150123 RepID=UPI003F165DB4
MAGPTRAELLATVAELSARNADLVAANAELESEQLMRSTSPTEEPPPLSGGAAGGAPEWKRRAWAWTVLSTVLILLGSLLAPVAVVAAWVRIDVSDTERFVAAYAPLADDPAVQRFVTDRAVAAIDEQVDIGQLTSDVVDGVVDLGTGPVATNALEALKGPIARGLVGLVRSTVSDFVASDAFSNTWAQALRVTHTGLVAALQGDPDAAISIGADGSIGVQLAPILVEVRERLVAQGLTFAANIPTVDLTVTVAQSDAVPTVQLAYGLAIGVGTWLPWVVLGLLVAGVVVARRRSVALIWAGIALALAMAVTAAAFSIARAVLPTLVSPASMPGDVTAALFDAVAGGMRGTATSLLVLAIVIAVVAWLAGPFRTPRKLRGLVSRAAALTRSAAERGGLTTGRVGEWLYLRRVLLQIAVAVVASAVILFVRPLTGGLVFGTLLVSALVLLVLEFVQRPVVAVPADADEEAPVVSV